MVSFSEPRVNQTLFLRSIDYEQSLFFLASVEQNARDKQMTTHVTEGARRERHALVSRVPLNVRARTPLHSYKSEERERLLTVYEINKAFQDRLTFINRHMIVWFSWVFSICAIY